MTHALIVDAYALFRASLREILRRSGNFPDIIEAASSDEFLSLNASDKTISLAIIHPRSIGLSETSCLAHASHTLKDARILIFRDTASASESLPDNPRVTILSRAAQYQDVESVIGTTSRARPSNRPARPTAHTRAPTLSRRQRQIMAMVAQGHTNKEIAYRLGIAEGTVKAHIHGAFRSLGVTNRTQAVIRYRPHLLAGA